MSWLLWREIRLNRLILIVGSIMVIMPYFVALAVVLWPKTTPMRFDDFLEIFGVASIYSLVVAQLIVALMGGNAMAGERADRSAEFMAYLPVRRIDRLTCKLIVAGLMAALIWGFNLLMLYVVVRLGAGQNWGPGTSEMSMALRLIAVTGLTFYCVGWLISSFQSSTTFAVGGALVTPLLPLHGTSCFRLVCRHARVRSFVGDDLHRDLPRDFCLLLFFRNKVLSRPDRTVVGRHASQVALIRPK